MGFLNFSISRMAYNDDSITPEPVCKAFDCSTVKNGLYISFPANFTKRVNPGQSLLLDSTARTLTYDGTTQFSLAHPEVGSDLMRMRWTGTGTAPGFRTYRATAGAADTIVEFVRVSNTAVKLHVTGGTAMSFATTLVGDEIFFEKTNGSFTSPFSEAIQHQTFSIVDVGVDYVVMRDNGIVSAADNITLGANYLSAFRIFSSVGVKVGDKVKFYPSANMNVDNKSYILEVTQLSDRDIYFINPYGLDETVIPGASSFIIFERMLNFLALQATGAIDLKLDSLSNTSIPVIEYENGKAMFMATLSATSIYAVNNGTHAVEVTVQSCSF